MTTPDYRHLAGPGRRTGSNHTIIVGASVLAASALLLTACGGQPAAETSSDGRVKVVASTDVYADVVSAIGGDRVDVTAIIDKPTQDPHSYEATAQDKLAISKAGLLVENGGGYDEFMHRMADELDFDHDFLLSAVVSAGLEEPGGHDESAEAEAHEHAEYNEHVWYDLSAVTKLGAEIAERLSILDPGSADAFAQRSGEFASRIGALESRLGEIKAAHDGEAVAVTEPVPLYLLEAAGLKNHTPEAFTEAIEEEQDVPPAALKEATELISSSAVTLLAYNSQTEGPQTESVKQAAESAGVPVVEFTETLPDGEDYAGWMDANVDAVAKALS